jgi:hypothetical protein
MPEIVMAAPGKSVQVLCRVIVRMFCAPAALFIRIIFVCIYVCIRICICIRKLDVILPITYARVLHPAHTAGTLALYSTSE